MKIIIGKKKFELDKDVISGKELKELMEAKSDQKVYLVADAGDVLIEDDTTVALYGDDHFKLKK